MIPLQTVLSIYFIFAILCAMPWLLNWAMHGAMPVTVRLVAFIAYSWVLVSVGGLLWTVYDQLPERFGDALTLLFPMVLFCVFGIVLVVKSLVEMVKNAPKDEDE
jgi:cytochrome bd-type quinol oxidase subunit 1